ncbi:TPA: relaxosome protein TraM [Enterobacter cloacae]|nr:relaxosome protein TraM [Enterobacter cloacae]
MPRIQTFVSNQVREEIESLVTERRQEGATENDATVSSVTSMLIELGLRVYRIQREKKEGGFNQMEYNRIMLDNMARVRAMCSEMIRMGMLSYEVISNGNFDNEVVKRTIAKFAEEQVSIFFPEDEDSEKG